MTGRRLFLVVLVAFGTLVTGLADGQSLSSSRADSTLVPQMIPLSDDRSLGAVADYMGFHSEEDKFPFPFSAWVPESTEAIAVEVHPCEDEPGELCSYGYAGSFAIQFSQFFGQAIQFSGTSSGKWIGEPSGTYSAHSLASFRFRLDVPFTFRYFGYVIPGDTPGYITLEGPTPDVRHFYTEGGVVRDSGQLGPGEYRLEAYSGVGPTSEEDTQGATYSIQWEVDPYIYRALGLHPSDQTVACGGTAVFTVGTIGPTPGLTYQWRRNGAPLTDDGHVSGSHAATLVIHGACDSDVGYYDVVLSSSSAPGGPFSEVSRVAHLGISTVTAVDVVPPESRREFTLSAAAPNPFAGETAFRYEAADPTRVTIAVYNVAGKRVRLLMDREVSGRGSVAWNGTIQTGARAPAGVYYVRVDAGAVHEHRKIVLLR